MEINHSLLQRKSNQFRHKGSLTDYENEFVKKDNEKDASNEAKKSMTFNQWKMNLNKRIAEKKKKDK